MKSSRIFFGWWIVAGSFLISLYVGGAVFYGFTAFFEPIAAELGWSYAQVALASSLRGLEAGILAPILGILVDRWGSRRLIFFGAIIAASGLLLISRSQSLIMFYGAFLLMSVGTSSCSGIVVMTAVANWFQRRIGIASAVAICGFGFSGLLVPLIVRLIDAYTWRGAFVILAGGLILLVLPLSVVFRHKPEHYGYLPDGDRPERAAPEGGEEAMVIALEQPAPYRADIGAMQAVRSGIFWRLVLHSLCHMIIVTSVILHIMPYLSSIGVPRSIAGVVAAAVPLASIAGRLLFGWLGDRIDRRLAAAAAFLMTGLGIFCLGFASLAGFALVLPFLFCFGIGYGGTNSLRIALVRHYFGRANFGSIFGLMVGISVSGGMAAPPLAGWVYDTWGSYQAIWFIFAALPIAALAALLSLPRGTRQACSVESGQIPGRDSRAKPEKEARGQQHDRRGGGKPRWGSRGLEFDKQRSGKTRDR